MNTTKRTLLTYVLPLLIVALLVACDKDFNNLGVDVIGSQNFKTETIYADVKTSNRPLERVRTSGLPIYQLGTYSNGIFGNTEASIAAQLSLPTTFLANKRFGLLSDEQEKANLAFWNTLTPAQQADTLIVTDEKERVKAVYLEIPFFSNAKQLDTDGDGAPDEIEINGIPGQSDTSDPLVADPDTDGDGVIDPLDTSADVDFDGINNEDEASGESPYYADSDGDGIRDDEDTVNNVDQRPRRFTIDSVFNTTTDFNIQINKLETYLRDLDPDTNFQNAQEYFSDFNPILGTQYYNGPGTISEFDVVVVKTEDDPATTEEDETDIERLTPRIRIALDVEEVTELNINTSSNDFQNELLNLEGGTALFNNINFTEHFRGIAFNLQASQNLLVNFNIAQARIVVKYEHARIDNAGTVTETSDDFIGTTETEIALGFTGNAVNRFQNSTIDTGDASRIILKGGQGVVSELNLFEADPSTTDQSGIDLDMLREDFRNNNWVLNEASIKFYVDETNLPTTTDFHQPERIFLYDLETGLPLPDFANDQSVGPFEANIKNIHGGILDSDDDGSFYKVRITEHIGRILDADSDLSSDTLNVPLGLSITSRINQLGSANAMEFGVTEEFLVPVGSVISRDGAQLYGGSAALDKRVRLEIIYTDPTQQDSSNNN